VKAAVAGLIAGLAAAAIWLALFPAAPSASRDPAAVPPTSTLAPGLPEVPMQRAPGTGGMKAAQATAPSETHPAAHAASVNQGATAAQVAPAVPSQPTLPGFAAGPPPRAATTAAAAAERNRRFLDAVHSRSTAAR
jgi:hypothetical protein